MPIHDWKRVEAGLFHHFHQHWTTEICARLNSGGLPPGYYALIDQRADGPVPDVLAVERLSRGQRGDEGDSNGGLAVRTAPPQTRFVMSADLPALEVYAARANRIAIHHPFGDVVAVIEVMSPGNKHSKNAIGKFIKKAIEFLDIGISVLIVDLLPPTKRDANGIHGAIWSELTDEPFELPADKRLTLVSYVGGADRKAFIEPVAVGDALPAMPLFLDDQAHVPVDLETTYMRTWSLCPAPMRELVETGKLSD
jgi:hypothetical protein